MDKFKNKLYIVFKCVTTLFSQHKTETLFLSSWQQLCHGINQYQHQIIGNLLIGLTTKLEKAFTASSLTIHLYKITIKWGMATVVQLQ